MRIRLYADEDAMAHRLARELRLRGLDITTALDEGMIERQTSIIWNTRASRDEFYTHSTLRTIIGYIPSSLLRVESMLGLYWPSSNATARTNNCAGSCE
jgi:hypothetical protein